MAIEIVDNNFQSLILAGQPGGDTNPLIIDQYNGSDTDGVIVFAVFWENSKGNVPNPVDARVTSTLYADGYQPELVIEESDGFSFLSVYYVVCDQVGTSQLKITFDDESNPGTNMYLTAGVVAVSFTGVNIANPIVQSLSNREASSEMVNGFYSSSTTNICIDFISAVITPYLDNAIAPAWGNVEISNNTFGTEGSTAILASSTSETNGGDGIFAWSLNNTAALIWEMVELRAQGEGGLASKMKVIMM